MTRTYKITARQAHVGGGWRLQLFEDDVEMGGGVFPVPAINPLVGMTWWNDQCNERERAHWLMMAASARPADAYHAFLLAEAYADAEAEAEVWLDNHTM